MTVYGNYFTVKACTIDANGVITAVRIIPESITISPWFHVENDTEMCFETRELAIESLAKNLVKITEEKPDEHVIVDE